MYIATEHINFDKRFPTALVQMSQGVSPEKSVNSVAAIASLEANSQSALTPVGFVNALNPQKLAQKFNSDGCSYQFTLLTPIVLSSGSVLLDTTGNTFENTRGFTQPFCVPKTDLGKLYPRTIPNSDQQQYPVYQEPAYSQPQYRTIPSPVHPQHGNNRGRGRHGNQRRQDGNQRFDGLTICADVPIGDRALITGCVNF